MNASLSSKLLVYLALITGITMLSVSFLAFNTTRQVLEKSIGQAQEALALETLEDIDRFLYERQHSMGIVARAIPFADVLSGHSDTNEDVTRMTDAFLASSGAWDALRLIRADGTPVLFSEETPLTAEEREAWQAAVAGEAYVSDAIPSDRSGTPTLLFAMPVRDEAAPGQPVLGVVIGYLSWDEIRLILSEVGAHADLYDRDGVVLEHNIVADAPHVDAATLGDLSAQTSTRIAAKDESALAVETLSSIAVEPGFRTYAGNGWRLLFETPTSVAFAPATEAALQMAALVLLICLASGAVVIAVMFPLVVHPLTSLSAAVRGMRDGDLSRRARVASTDELGYLARSFNEMAERLQRSYSLLEGRLDDITDAKDRIEEDKARDDAMFASIGEGIIATDRHGNVVMVNAAAESMLGYASRELVGSSYSEIELVDEKGRPVVRARRPIFRALKAGRRVTVEPSDMEWSYVRKDRQPIPVSITASPIAFRGKTIGVIEVFRDIRKEVEQDRILQDFISIASHQLRSPLTGIYWILERVLREERLSKEGRQNLDDVYLLTRNLNELVSLMLNASRIDAGKIPLVVERIDAVKATRRHLAGYQPLCDRKGVVCALEDHPSTLKVRTVPALFSLIVEALISNAIDYTATGGRVGVCIEVKRSRFVLTVRDTGIGIPEQDHARVFQKFYRGSNAVLVKPGGTGLGLYSVRQAAQLLGGSVRFESKVGQGTAFYVELPLETKVSKGR